MQFSDASFSSYASSSGDAPELSPQPALARIAQLSKRKRGLHASSTQLATERDK